MKTKSLLLATALLMSCLLYTSDAADDSLRVDLGGRRIIKKIYFFQAEDGIRDVERSRGLGDVYKRQEQKKFIADFYKYSFVGVMLDWIKRGMKEAPEEIANMVCVTMHGNVGNSLRNMEKEGQ